MLRVGITGGIGSGKTTVCKLFELQGIAIFYADQEAKKAMSTDQQLMSDIRTQFGNDIYSSEGTLNRSKLASIVFNDDRQLAMLNSIVHPAVFRLFDEWVDQQTSAYVIKEAALLFESNSYKDCHSTILVKSPELMRISRVVKRDRITEQDVLKRMAKQLGDNEKEKLSEYVIINDERTLIIPQVLDLHSEFLKRAQLNDTI